MLTAQATISHESHKPKKIFSNIVAPKFLPSPIRMHPNAQLTNLIKEGFELHRQGNLTEAKDFYQQALGIDPNCFEALQLLGALLVKTQHYLNAIEILSQALLVDSSSVACLINLGIALKELGHLEQALTSYNKSLSIEPNNADAHFNRGNVLKGLGLLDQALSSYRQAIFIDPKYLICYFYRGNLERELGLLEDALTSYNQAIAIKPDFGDAFINRGATLQELGRFEEALTSYVQAKTFSPNSPENYYNLGIVLKDLGRFEEAIASYDKALEIKPNHAEAYSNRGNALKDLGRFEEALASYDKALEIKPNYAEGHSNRGVALQELGILDQALASHRTAISINPNFAEAYSNQGFTLQEIGRLEDALLSYDKAISIDPNCRDAHWNKSICQLLGGDFKNGWQAYEWRWRNKDSSAIKKHRNFPQPLWLGDTPLEGKTILLYAEQGLGDTIQFSRYAPLVAELGAKVLLEVQPTLAPLLKGLNGTSQVLANGEKLPQFDYQCPLLSLPLAFKTNLYNLPAPASYIKVNTAKVARWQKILGSKTLPRIGLVWSGSTTHKNDRNRSLSLEKLTRYLPNHYEYISLQKELRAGEQQLLARHHKIRHFGHALKDFSDTAALCELMDFIISIDTSVAHLAGTLNIPTWLLLPYSPDWRWLLDRSDSPWYPSMHLFRQTKIGVWEDVLEKVVSSLDKLPQ